MRAHTKSIENQACHDFRVRSNLLNFFISALNLDILSLRERAAINGDERARFEALGLEDSESIVDGILEGEPSEVEAILVVDAREDKIVVIPEDEVDREAREADEHTEGRWTCRSHWGRHRGLGL
ncbi:hypothetical protein Sjap_007794 [Stephania japonica]|uniref:Uncharacterized protein n=1 Tax=Stephania japonica TaxID=461633 RepID=A0AAP0PE05_9MAGN